MESLLIVLFFAHEVLYIRIVPIQLLLKACILNIFKIFIMVTIIL